MPDPVIETVSLGNYSGTDRAMSQWAAVLAEQLIEVVQQHGYRINRSINQDGAIPMENPLRLAPYLAASLPTAASWPGGIIYVSDGAAGTKFRGSDGAAWVNLG